MYNLEESYEIGCGEECGDFMEWYNSQEELYLGLLPAIHVKLKLLKKSKNIGIKEEDIWNYLKDSKWKNSVDLTLADMVCDIIRTDNDEFIQYKRNLKESIF